MSGDATAFVAWVAAQMSSRREEFVAGLVLTTRSEIQSLDHDARMAELLHASITENVVAAIHFLGHGGAETDVKAPGAAVAYACALAQRDVPLSALIRAYRIGHGRFVDEAMALLSTQTSPEQSLRAARELVHRAAVWIDQVCDQVGTAYEQERDRWVSSRSGLRQHWVNEVLSSATIDIGKVEDALNYRLSGQHVAAVMWPDDAVAARDVADVFDHAQSQLGIVLRASGPSLMVPTDEREVRLWLPVERLECAGVHTVFGENTIPVRVSIGDLGDGIDGFRRSLREAEQAKVVAVAGGPAVGRVVCHRHVAPVALMAANVADLRRFVQRTLGALAVDDERNGWLRETLREFLARNRSFAATADAMFLHRNTIQYRVTQAMVACGASFDEVDIVADIQIALTACRWMGKSVLSPVPPAR